jgi:ADP-ribosylglycohydrolase
MIGMAIGDALGAHVEFRPQSYLEENPVKDLQGGGTWGLEKGQVIIYTNLTTLDYINKRFFTIVSLLRRKTIEP